MTTVRVHPQTAGESPENEPALTVRAAFTILRSVTLSSPEDA